MMLPPVAPPKSLSTNDRPGDMFQTEPCPGSTTTPCAPIADPSPGSYCCSITLEQTSPGGADLVPATAAERPPSAATRSVVGWKALFGPDFGPVQGRNPLGLRFLRRFRLARTVEGDRLANERLEGGLVNFFSFVDVDRAACVSVETRVEETGRILQRRALKERQLHDVLVGLACAYQSVVGPDRDAP